MAKAKRTGGYYLDKRGTPRNAMGERIEAEKPAEEVAQGAQKSREDVSLGTVPFTQQSVQDEAESYGLEPADFEEYDPSSERGYTADDVRNIADA